MRLWSACYRLKEVVYVYNLGLKVDSVFSADARLPSRARVGISSATIGKSSRPAKLVVPPPLSAQLKSYVSSTSDPFREGNVYRPDPIPVSHSVTAINRGNDWNASARALVNGEQLLVTDLYSTGLNTLAALRRLLEGRRPGDRDFSREREFRSEFQRASQNLLATVASHRLSLEKAPEIGWFSELYSDTPDFLLPFPQVQGLNSSWQWFVKGIEIPVLDRRLFPYYGTYFPTRFEHLELFDAWLQDYEGPRQLACDVGTGCGVLALQLAQAKFARVLATDSNPNAVERVQREIARQPASCPVEVQEADLFGAECEPLELIVFNPPWIRGAAHSPIDQAIYYDDTLFERFFDMARQRIAAEGRLVLLFSNLQQTADTSAPHPIQQELEGGGHFALVDCKRRQAKSASAKTKRRKRDPANEFVELWELAAR